MILLIPHWCYVPFNTAATNIHDINNKKAAYFKAA